MVTPWWKEGLAGAAGALLRMVLVYGIQLSRAAMNGEVKWRASTQRVAGVIGFVLCYLLLGGVAPFVGDAHAIKEAVIEGLGWQGVFAQFIKPRAEQITEDLEPVSQAAE